MVRPNTLTATLPGRLKQLTVLSLLFLPSLMMLIFIHLALIIELFRTYFKPRKPSRISTFKEGPMVEVTRVSTSGTIDFIIHRSPTYAFEVTFGALWEFGKRVAGLQKCRLIGDKELYNVLMYTGFTAGLQRAGLNHNNVEWILELPIENYELLPGFYWDIKTIQVHKDKSISLIDRKGNLHSPHTSFWDFAKAHAQVQLTYYAPGNAHNHVHFIFPSIMACLVRERLPKKSNLRKLLEPHTRFTEYINHKALHHCKSSDNHNYLTERCFKPWLCMPTTNHYFLKNIKEATEDFYLTKGLIRRKLDLELPYDRFISEYYDIVLQFVKNLSSKIDLDFETLVNACEEYIPCVSCYEPIEVIATLIWNNAIVHYSDHESFTELFARKYGCMSMRKSLFGEDLNSLDEFDEDDFDSKFFYVGDVYRTQVFVNTFVRYNRCYFLDLTLTETDYGFTNPEAIYAVRQFRRQLLQKNREFDNINLNIIDLKSCVRTICF